MATKNIRGDAGGATADSENHSGQREGSHAFLVASSGCFVGFAFTWCAFANTQYRLHRVLSKCKHPLPIEARRALPLVLQHWSRFAWEGTCPQFFVAFVKLVSWVF